MPYFFYKTLLYTVLIFVLVTASGEALVRTSSIQAHLPTPYLGSNYRPPTFQFHQLHLFDQAHGPIDCLFIGSSIVHNGINPVAFESAYFDRTGQRITCYNFGLYNLTVGTASPIAKVLIEMYNPRFIMMGFQAWEVSDYIRNEFEPTFAQTDWMRYQNGQLTLNGWLLANLYSYRYLRVASEVLFPLPRYIAPQPALDSRFWAGYLPMSSFSSPTDTPFFAPQQRNLRENAPLSEPEFAIYQDFLEYIHQRQIPMLVIEMPTFTSQSLWQEEQRHYDSMETIARYTREQGIPFWFLSDYNFIPLYGWSDFSHVDVTYSIILSHWLGQQVGVSLQGDLTTNLASPPIADLDFTMPPRYGFSEAMWQDFQTSQANFDMIPLEATIFSPERNTIERDFLIHSTAAYIEWIKQLPASQKQTLFDLITVLEAVTYQAPSDYSAWQNSRLPDDLVGVDYLFYSSLWAGWLSEAELQLLQSPQHYELIQEWIHPTTRVNYFLYKVVR